VAAGEGSGGGGHEATVSNGDTVGGGNQHTPQSVDPANRGPEPDGAVRKRGRPHPWREEPSSPPSTGGHPDRRNEVGRRGASE
jgi:hypothetical protein